MKEGVRSEAAGSIPEVIASDKLHRKIGWGIWITGNKRMIVTQDACECTEMIGYRNSHITTRQAVVHSAEMPTGPSVDTASPTRSQSYNLYCSLTGLVIACSEALGVGVTLPRWGRRTGD